MDTVNIFVGPTASGKTSLVLNLCKKFCGEIISADSRQIYKGMDVGTGKVPVKSDFNVQNFVNYWTFDDVVIWGYDLVNPDEYFSAYDFARFALPKAKEILERGRKVFLVGGTGFYVDIITKRKLPADVKPDFELREALETTPTKNLLEWLMSLNPDKGATIDQNNRARIIRALEIELAEEKKKNTPLPFLENTKFNFIGLTGSRDLLYSRADVWLDDVWGGGLIEETESLIAAGYGETRPLNGLVYKSVKAFIEDKVSEEETKQRAKYDLHAYIRRQQTYFKKNKDIKWFDIEKPSFAERIADHVQFK